MISDDPAIVRFFQEHLGGGVGINPVHAYLHGD